MTLYAFKVDRNGERVVVEAFSKRRVPDVEAAIVIGSLDPKKKSRPESPPSLQPQKSSA